MFQNTNCISKEITVGVVIMILLNHIFFVEAFCLITEVGLGCHGKKGQNLFRTAESQPCGSTHLLKPELVSLRIIGSYVSVRMQKQYEGGFMLLEEVFGQY